MRTFRLLSVLFLAGLLGASISYATEKCLTCHKESNPGLYLQWKDSAHGKNDIGCLDCHGAEESDVDAFKHNGETIATLVTPKDCGQCHEEIEKETSASYHATAGEILASQDAYMGYAAGGEPAVIVGCEACHGGKVKIDPNAPNKLSSKTWPNSGVGRLNPDGSKGSCNACHSRHSFSVAQARQPETCGKCHLGPDHPQKEIYEESKHGIAYYTNRDKMALDSDPWVVGVDYYEAPTCATCHMSATKIQPATHDVGKRISWTLRPPVSKHKDNWEAKRDNMKDVCSSCHQERFVDGHYYQFDAQVGLYDNKFGKPAAEIMKMIKEAGVLESPAEFSNKVEWIYWEIWHHEGRRARMGAAMMGPDYAWWHGIYDVAQHFYFDFIPEARKYNNKKVNAYIDDLLANDPMHTWMSQDTTAIKKAIKSGEFQKIYDTLFDEK